MKQIKTIVLSNIKGIKDSKTINLNNCFANNPVFLVAPNGYGKSTFALAIKSLMPSKLEVEKFKNAELKIMFEEDGSNIELVANSETNTFTNNIYTHVINLSTRYTVQAYGFVKKVNQKIQDVVLFNNIPAKVELDYKINEIKGKYNNIKEYIKNRKEIFNDLYNISIIVDNLSDIKNCNNHSKPKIIVAKFIESISLNNFNIELLRENAYLNNLLQIIEKFNINDTSIPNWEILLQLLELVEHNDFKNIYKYLRYLKYKERLDNYLHYFNTTGREIKTKKDGSKLIVQFYSPNEMSNGERDILYFLSSLSEFEINFTKDRGLLVIDEIFDYLDGCNMLSAQYFLSIMIKNLKKTKNFYCIILTHLDPQLFNNYFFRDAKFNYLSNCQITVPKESIIKLLEKRNDSNFANDIAKYFLHHTDEKLDKTLENTIIAGTGIESRGNFFIDLKNEIKCYIEDKKYDVLSVICQIRLSIEKIVYSKFTNEDDKIQFLKTYKTIDKLRFANKKGIDVDEIFYFLQPLYNDALHLHNKENQIINATIKLNSKIIKKITSTFYEEYKSIL